MNRIELRTKFIIVRLDFFKASINKVLNVLTMKITDEIFLKIQLI